MINLSQDIDGGFRFLRTSEDSQKGCGHDSGKNPHGSTHRFTRLNTECQYERTQRGFIADGSRGRPMNFDQRRVAGLKKRKPHYI